MNRYTTKHSWRMTESEQGEWVRYGEYKEIVDLVSMDRDSYRELYREEQFSKWEAMGLAEHLNYRVHVLNIILMATYGGIVAKLIGWSLGL